MDEFGIRPVCPATRGFIELVRKDTHRNRNGDALGSEEGQLTFPIETSRRDSRVRQPVERDVVQDGQSGEFKTQCAIRLRDWERDSGRPVR